MPTSYLSVGKYVPSGHPVAVAVVVCPRRPSRRPIRPVARPIVVVFYLSVPHRNIEDGSIPGRQWREKNKLIDKIIAVLKERNVEVSCTEAVPVALKEIDIQIIYQ